MSDDLHEWSKRTEQHLLNLLSIPYSMLGPAGKILVDDIKREQGIIESVTSTPEDTVLVEHCDDGLSMVPHEPHFHIPGFMQNDPDEDVGFVCGGWPKVVIDIEERRDLK